MCLYYYHYLFNSNSFFSLLKLVYYIPESVFATRFGGRYVGSLLVFIDAFGYFAGNYKFFLYFLEGLLFVVVVGGGGRGSNEIFKSWLSF